MRSRPLLVAGALLVVLLAVALLLLTPSFLVVGLLHDAAAPPAVARVLPAAKEQLHKAAREDFDAAGTIADAVMVVARGQRRDLG